MHRALWLALLAGLALSFVTATDARADWLERSWTNTEGKKITAKFIRSTPTMALLNQDGKVIRAPLNQLTQADRDWIVAAEELKKMREWQLLDGTSHRARLQEIEEDMLTLEERSETIQLFVSELNPEDQALVAQVTTISGGSGIATPSASSVGSTASRQWTDKNGKKIDAEYRRVEGDKVVLYFRDKEWRVPLADLSDEDRQFIEGQQGGSGIASNEAPAPRSPGEMTQQERIDELLRKRRERAERLAQNPPPTPPVHEAPSDSSPSHQPSFPEPQFPDSAHERFGPPSFANDHGPRHRRGWDEPTEEEAEYYPPQPVYQQVIVCEGCRYENPASSFKAGDKCRGCGRRIDIIRNEDGTTQSSSASYSGRKIGRIIGGVAALIGLLFGMLKKAMG